MSPRFNIYNVILSHVDGALTKNVTNGRIKPTNGFTLKFFIKFDQIERNNHLAHPPFIQGSRYKNLVQLRLIHNLFFIIVFKYV